MRGRVLCRISSKAAKLRRQRRKEAKAEVCEVISTFLQAANGMELASDDSMTMTRPNADHDELIRAADDNSDEEFWMNLPACDSRTGHIQGIPT